MRFVIQTENDIQFLQGKFVLQINSDTPDKRLMDFEWGFVKEKRLSIVCGFGLVSLHGQMRDYDTFDKFQKMFNNYLFDHMIEQGKTDGGRFMRLLTSKEIDYLMVKIKEENY